MFKSIIAFIIVLAAAFAAESLTMPEDKTPPVVTLIQHEPEYFENTEIVGSENAFNIEKFSNPTPVPRSGDDVPPFVNGFLDDNTAQESSMLNVVPATRDRLTKSKGVHQGPSGRESWYNLNMNGVLKIMRDAGFSESEYPYWVREDGCKMLGDYIMVAANLNTRPRGTILETSLGLGIVCDTGSFVNQYPDGVDVATSW